jgi:nicotinamide-nucleotide adenylyltransferase
MKALFIGRFQPFHNGHLLILKSIYNQYNEIIIGIGSSQYSNTIDNPFSENERRKMIKKSLENIGIQNYKIVSIPDIHNPPKWVSYVVSIVNNINIVISNNPFTKKLFREQGYQIKGTDFFKKEVYSGEEIRRRMIYDESWEDLVPESVVKVIKEINGIQRLKNLLL